MRYIAVDTETRGLGGELLGLCVVGEDFSNSFSAEELKSVNFQLVLDANNVVFHNASYDVPILRREGYTIDKYHDTMIMAHLLNPLEPCGLDYLGTEHLGLAKLSIEDKGNLEWNDETARYCERDGLITYKLFHFFEKCFENHKSTWEWYVNHELPFVEAIIEMERLGLVINRMKTYEAIEEFTVLKDKAAVVVAESLPFMPDGEAIYKKQTPEGFGYYVQKGVISYDHCKLTPFNPNSPTHITTWLKAKGWEHTKETKGGKPATDAEVLLELSVDYPVLKTILTYKDYSKALGTYLEAFLEHSYDLDGVYSVLHGSFNQTGTITGRLSSSQP